MRNILFSVSCLLAVASNAAALVYSITNDHADLLYRVGERATFQVSVAEKDGKVPTSGVVHAKLDNFGPRTLAYATWDLATNHVFTMVGALDEPGFLRLTLNAKDSPAKVWGVGVAPGQIVKGSPSPADFDAFWAEARAKFRRDFPNADVQLEKVTERSTKDFDFYRISLVTYGRRVHGYLSVPTDKAKAPFPVDFGVNAAGFGNWTNNMQGSPDAIVAQFSVYPFPPDWRWEKIGLKAQYDAMNDDCQKTFGARYSCAGIGVAPEKYFFYPVILGIDRAVDWLAAREDVDRRRFRYQGTSQGGGFGFYLTGLNRAFTRAAFYVPAITDTMGCLAGRQSGWPSILENNSGTPDRRATAEKWAPYFDGANFASRITCPVRVAVGFADTTCAPCAVYAAYNEIKVKDKDIVHGFGMSHSCFGKFYECLGAWVRQ
ncbi:MAG: acetylxylan esterase [Kiritimatiellae bacterium]|nr:acetylxylan esterase [Kiritimatiellia bacterium]